MPNLLQGVLTVQQAESYLKVGRTRLYEIMKRDLPYCQIGARRRILESDLQEYVMSLRVQPAMQ